MKRLFLILPILMLSACVSPNSPPTETELAKARGACVAYGFKSGTDNMAACMANQIQSTRSDQKQRMQAFGQALQNAGNNMQQSSPAHTNCRFIGNQMYCNTY